jgi:1-deoxy-D-xylulose-5-phosphate synthase
MAYEAMNNAAGRRNRLVVILNDNDMSIAPPVGGLSAIWRGWSPRASSWNCAIWPAAWPAPAAPVADAAKKTDEFARGMAMGGTLFEELGFYYVGPIDGHDLDRWSRCSKTCAMPPKARS